MSTFLEVYRDLCTADRIPAKRRKNFLTSLRYLAKSVDATPEQCPVTRDLEATYAERLQAYLTAHGKSRYVIRNAVQEVKQLFEQAHALTHTAPVPTVVTTPKPLKWHEALAELGATSPYNHQTWMTHSLYVLPPAQWPQEVRTHYERWRRLRKDQVRPATIRNFTMGLESLLGYLHLTGEERLLRIHPEAQKKIALKRYEDDRQQILTTPQTVAWDDCFVVDHLKSFVTWHAWRVHTPQDAQVKERPPSKPTTLGVRVVDTMRGFADTLKRREKKRLDAYGNSLPLPRKMHDSFTFAELEAAALAIMDEPRHMYLKSIWNGKGMVKHPGTYAASKFQTGLILFLACRNPMRARNWCEALLDTNLRKVDGGYRWHFEGDELKIATRRGKTNVHELDVDPEALPYLREFLDTWRPLLPGADTDRHVFLMGKGAKPLTVKALHMRLKVQVYRHTKKRLYTHLLRTIFTSNLLSANADINTVAYLLNDDPKTVLARYNELQGVQHQQSFREAYARALRGNGNGGSH
jgi:hypothetical protein